MSAYGRRFSSATFRGRPICWNIGRAEVNHSGRRDDWTELPPSRLLPASHSSTSRMIVWSSLRRVKSRSLRSTLRGTRKRRLLMPGWPKSVGPGIASSSTKRLVLERRRGMKLEASQPWMPPGSRLK